MKEQIYTIPVLDAFKSDSECPFCKAYTVLERNSINFVLGPSYMENDVRDATNEMGFCSIHYKILSEEKNRLGLALMLHTHMVKVRKDLTKLLSDTSTSKKSTRPLFAGLTKNLKNITDDTPVSGYINKVHDDCYLCSKIESTFHRYIDTFFYLWKKDPEFLNLVKNSKGFCLQHFGILFNAAPKSLNKNALQTFYDVIIPLQLQHFQRVEEDLEWFTRKFDYRYENEPWKNAKDALPRAIQKVASIPPIK